MTLASRRYRAIDLVRLPFSCAPYWMSVLIALELLSGLAPTLAVLANGALIDTAMSVISGTLSISASAGPIAAVVGILAFQQCARAAFSLCHARVRMSQRAVFRPALLDMIGDLEYRHIENSDAHDLIARTLRTAEQRTFSMTTTPGSLLSTGVQVAGILALLLAYAPFSALIITVIAVPLFFLAFKGGRATYEADRSVSKIKRRSEYLSEMLRSREGADERALFGFGPAYNKRYIGEFLRAYRVEFLAKAKWMIRTKAGGVATAAFSFVLAMTLLPPVLSGAMSLGVFVSLMGGMSSLTFTLSWGLSNMAEEMARNREYLRDIEKLANLSRTSGARDLPSAKPFTFESLELRDVRFTYPGTETEVLKGLSLRMEAGRHYAVVGGNGAGKTTMTKLVMGLYDGYQGEILLNDKPLGEYAQAEMKAAMAAVMQDFAQYGVSLHDNIAVGHPAVLDTERASQSAAGAVARAGLAETLAKLNQGYLTPLGKAYENGQDISGGEWQKVAMARALVNPAPLRILDEPTAALDPLSESAVYQDFDRLFSGMTTLFISHRLGATKLADEIFVLADGAVVERGAHADLMEKGGLYAEMFESQRSWYA